MTRRRRRCRANPRCCRASSQSATSLDNSSSWGSALRTYGVSVDVALLGAPAEVIGEVLDRWEAVNSALRETTERLRRAHALARLAELAESGAFDELLDKNAHRE